MLPCHDKRTRKYDKNNKNANSYRNNKKTSYRKPRTLIHHTHFRTTQRRNVLFLVISENPNILNPNYSHISLNPCMDAIPT